MKVAAVLSMLVAGLPLGGCGDVVTSRFADYGSAQKAGIFDAGWLPEYLPRSSRDIEETHDIDTNRVDARFVFTPGDAKEVETACKLRNRSESGATFDCENRKMRAVIFLGQDGHGSYSSPGDGV